LLACSLKTGVAKSPWRHLEEQPYFTVMGSAKAKMTGFSKRFPAAEILFFNFQAPVPVKPIKLSPD